MDTARVRTSRRSTPRKKKANQIPFGVLLVLALIGVGIYLGTQNARLALFWGIGIIFGHILQRGRFCFTASMRDPYLTGSTSVTRAVLIAFALTTIGFAAIKYGAHLRGLPIPGQGFVVPVSLATVIGAFIFGIGMVIGGGCASGTLMRVGEGFILNILCLVFFLAGSLLGAYHFGWWKETFISKGTPIFLPDYLGWAGAIGTQLLVILLLYIAAEKFEARRKSL